MRPRFESQNFFFIVAIEFRRPEELELQCTAGARWERCRITLKRAVNCTLYCTLEAFLALSEELRRCPRTACELAPETGLVTLSRFFLSVFSMFFEGFKITRLYPG